MGVLDVLSGLSTAAGKGYEGYGQDEQIKVKDALAQAKAAQDAERDRVLSVIGMAGIDPTQQRALAGAKAAGETEGATPGLGARETLLGGIKTRNHIADIIGTAQPTADAKALEVTTTAQPEAKAAGIKAAAIGANTPEKKQPVITTNTLPGGGTQQHVSAFGDKTGNVVDTGAQAKEAPVGTGGGSLRGLGQGGVFGAGSGLGAVKEMDAANPNLKTFEKNFLTDGPQTASQLGALDRFRQKLANDLQTHGLITAATATEAENELAKTNPDLVVYGRNLKQWIVSDLNLSRSATDKRGALDAEVSGLSVPLSSMPLDQRTAYINQIWEARDARLSGLKTAAGAAQVMLDRVTGGGKGGAAVSDADLWEQKRKEGLTADQATAFVKSRKP